jgi:hypothetical protein
MRSKKVMAKKPAAKKVMAKKPAAKKVMAKGKVPVQKYQVGGVAAPARTTMATTPARTTAATPAARPAPSGFLGGMLARQGMTPRSSQAVPPGTPIPADRRPKGGMVSPVGGGLIPNNPGGMSRGMPTTPAQFEQSLGADRNNYVRNDRGDFFLRPPPGTTPAQAEQMYRAQMARLQAMQQGAGGSMIANNGGGLIPPPNSRPRPVPMNQPVITPPPRPNVPGITPPMNRPVRTPPQPQGMPQGMSPAMQQYAQMMQQRQGMPQQGQQFMQSVRAGAPTAGPTAQVYPAMPQPLTQQQLQQLQQLGQPLNQAPARFKGGGEAKKKAAAQGRMAKPAGRGRTTKPAVRGRMAKPTRGKK